MDSTLTPQTSPFQRGPPTQNPCFRQSLDCCCSSRRITAQHELPKDSHQNKFQQEIVTLNLDGGAEGSYISLVLCIFWMICSEEVQCSCFLLLLSHEKALTLLTVRAVCSYDRKRLQLLWKKKGSSLYLYLHERLLTLAAGLGNVSRKPLTLVKTKSLCSTQPEEYLEALS